MVFKSTFADVHPPKQYKDSLSEFYWHQLDVFADKCLFEYPDGRRQWTGAQIKDKARQIGRYLVDQLGVKQGASVCNWYEHDTKHEHQHMLNSMRPKVVFIESNIYSEMVELRRCNDGLDYTICIMNDASLEDNIPNDVNSHNYKPWVGFERNILTHEPMSEVEAKSRGKSLPIEVDGSDAAYVLLTSGSTGLPKPVSRSHRNSIYVCHSLSSADSPWRMDHNSILCGHLPLDHGTGTFSIKMTLAKGLKLIILDGNFNMERILEAIHEFRITDCMLGTAYLYNLVNMDSSHLAKYNLSSLKNLISIGSRMSSHANNVNLMNKLPGLSIRQAFGMTEVGFISIVPAEDAKTDNTTCGVILPNIQISLRDHENGEPIEQYEQEGELYVSGPTVSPGYIGADLAEQSRAVFLPDGYYRSRDICMITKEQKVVIKGRYSELLCFTDGWKVLPSEIELTICGHPKVKEAAVIGLPHPTMPTLHLPRAFVVPMENTQLTGKEVFDYVAELLSDPKHLYGGVFILNSFPRTSIGKTDKKVLRTLDIDNDDVIDKYLHK